jgi:hypothetical protein
METPRRRRIGRPAAALRHAEGVGTSSSCPGLARNIRLPLARQVLERKDNDPLKSPTPFFLLISTDPDRAFRQRWRVRSWDFLFFYATFGVVATTSVRIAGIAVGESMMRRLLIGWGFGTLVSVTGMLASALPDLPTEATVVRAFGLTLFGWWWLTHLNQSRGAAVESRYDRVRHAAISGMSFPAVGVHCMAPRSQSVRAMMPRSARPEGSTMQPKASEQPKGGQARMDPCASNKGTEWSDGIISRARIVCVPGPSQAQAPREESTQFRLRRSALPRADHLPLPSSDGLSDPVLYSSVPAVFT